MKKKTVLLSVLAFAAVGLVAFAGARYEVRSLSYPVISGSATEVEKGAAAFVGADFGGVSVTSLSSHALPWRLASAALVMQARADNAELPIDMDTLNKQMASYGFLVGAEIGNLPETVKAPSLEMPLGMTYGDLYFLTGLPVRVSNMGCASCHAGVTYQVDGRPNPGKAWLGMPNTSLDLEAYTVGLFEAMRASIQDPAALMDTVMSLYPDISARESFTLRYVVLPLVAQRLAQVEGDRPLPFSNGSPGATNGVAALKFVFDMPTDEGDRGFVSIPDLGYRHWRSSLLVDGAYALPDEDLSTPSTVFTDSYARRKSTAALTSFFTVPSMGVHPETAREHREDAEAIINFLADAYAPQPFPGQIDEAAAFRGGIVYAQNCAACHGDYTEEGSTVRLISYPNWMGEVQTDPTRARSLSKDVVAQIESTVYGGVFAPRQTLMYNAPPLSGIWASAPYLHNGSVPTLHALLNPDLRPERFLVGGHALDFQQVGILLKGSVYPDAYTPFSTPVMYDTTKPGMSNAGHRFGEELSPADRADLIEYLKKL